MQLIVNFWQSINIVSILLWPISLLYCALVWLRRAAYRSGVFASYSINLPVIIVGNITVGGTGKTPLVIWLANWLQSHGHRPGIVLRGYGGKSRTWPRRVEATTTAREVGDEAVLLSQRSGCPVVAAPNRVAAARTQAASKECTIILSDDGLQHYRLRRDYEILVVDGALGYGNGFCLPAGPLREPTGRTESVDLVVTNRAGKEAEMVMTVVPTGIRNLQNNNRVNLDKFSNETVHAVAGIGNPSRFFDSLTTLGVRIIEHVFPDHHVFSADDLIFNDGNEIIMTEKDAVKCIQFARKNHWVLEVEAKPSKAVIEKLKIWLGEINDG